MPAGPESTGARKASAQTPVTRPSGPSLDTGLIAAAGAGAQLHELSITRFFDAPRESVYHAFINSDERRQWLGPRGFTATRFEQDARPGGGWRGVMHQSAPWQGRSDYPDLGMGGVYKELIPPEKLVYTFAWEGQGGQPTRETEITIRLTELGANRTKMVFHQAFFDAVEQRDGHNVGWNSAFDRLDDLLREMGAETQNG
jgi:uncharacterized protein YndB with AHSA1/START domain